VPLVLNRPDPPVDALGPTRLSQRVLIHIAREGTGPIGGAVPHRLCQEGIAEALGVTQGALSGVLRRLVAGGALVSEKAHVQGHDRRLKVNLLAPRGREIVRRLWKEFPDSRAAPRPRERPGPDGAPATGPGDRQEIRIRRAALESTRR
jgi:DNA-binding MarR family transcriptional regulator